MTDASELKFQNELMRAALELLLEGVGWHDPSPVFPNTWWLRREWVREIARDALNPPPSVQMLADEFKALSPEDQHVVRERQTFWRFGPTGMDDAEAFFAAMCEFHDHSIPTQGDDDA